jgi:hypothetical protein
MLLLQTSDSVTPNVKEVSLTVLPCRGSVYYFALIYINIQARTYKINQIRSDYPPFETTMHCRALMKIILRHLLTIHFSLYITTSSYESIIACRAVSRQWICKHVPVATVTHATINLLLEAVFSARFVQLYLCGSEVKYVHRDPASRRRRRKGSPAQSFSGPSPLGLASIFYCLRFETSLPLSHGCCKQLTKESVECNHPHCLSL